MRKTSLLVLVLLLVPVVLAAATLYPNSTSVDAITEGAVCPSSFKGTVNTTSPLVFYVCSDPDLDGVYRWQIKNAAYGDLIGTQDRLAFWDTDTSLTSVGVSVATGNPNSNYPKTQSCWDLGGGVDDSPDGTCDAFWNDGLGIVDGSGKPMFSEPVGVVSIAQDLGVQEWWDDNDNDGTAELPTDFDGTLQSGENSGLSAAVLLARQYGMPHMIGMEWSPQCYEQNVASAATCTNMGCQAADIDADGQPNCVYGMSREYTRDLVYTYGIELGTHPRSHCGYVSANIDFYPLWATAGSQRGNYSTGTVSISAGTPTITGSGAVFDNDCITSGGVYTPVGAAIRVDCDNDGAVEWEGDAAAADWETTIAYINEATDVITASSNAPSCSASSGLKYEIRSSPSYWYSDLKLSKAELESRLPSGGVVDTHIGMGPTEENHIINTVRGASGVPYESSSYNNMETSTPPGAGMLGEVQRWMPYCDNTEATARANMRSILDTIVEGRLNVSFVGHQILSNCGGAPGGATLSTYQYEEMLSYGRTLMRQGKLIVASVPVSIKLASMWKGRLANYNMIANPNLRRPANWAPTTIVPFWPWRDADTDADTYNTTYIDWDGTTNKAKLKVTGGATTIKEINYYTRLPSGHYLIGANVVPSGIVPTVDYGVRLKLYIGGMGGVASENLLKPVWVISPSIADASHNKSWGAANHAQYQSYSPWVDGTNTGRQITGFLYIPPEWDNTDVILDLEWAFNSGGSYALVSDISIVAYTPRTIAGGLNYTFGGRAIHPWRASSIVPQLNTSPGAISETLNLPAFQYVWAPHSTNDAARPRQNLFEAYVETTESISPAVYKTVWRIGGPTVSPTQWNDNMDPTEWIGSSYSNKISQSCYAIGTTDSATGTWMSGSMCGSDRNEDSDGVDEQIDLGIDFQTNSISELYGAYRFKARNMTGVFSETLVNFTYGGSNTPVARVRGDGTLDTLGGVRLGDTGITPGNGLCVKRTTCSGQEALFIDMDCSGTNTAGDAFLITGTTSWTATCTIP